MGLAVGFNCRPASQLLIVAREMLTVKKTRLGPTGKKSITAKPAMGQKRAGAASAFTRAQGFYAPMLLRAQASIAPEITCVKEVSRWFPLSDIQAEVPGFLEILGLTEEPLGMFYTAVEPPEGFSPQSAILPNVDQEAAGEVDWAATFENFACVIGLIWRARKLGKPAYFDQNRFGCLGGAFYLGFLKPQLEFITHYVSTGIPNVLEGECYLESPEVTPPVLRDHRPPAGPGALLRLQIPEPVCPRGEPRGGDLFRPGGSHRRPQPVGHLRHQRL